VARSIEEYLEGLRRELADSDAALVQDALYDAEDHLRSELARLPEEEREEALAGIIERYGSPAEIAEAYRVSEETVGRSLRIPPAAPGPRPNGGLGPFFGVLVDPRAYLGLFYMFLSLVTGIIYFTWTVTGVSLSVGLIVLIIGIPFILLFLAVTRVLSYVEGRMVEALLGVRMPRRPRYEAGTEGWMGRIAFWVKDGRTWTTFLYLLLMLPLGILYFTLVVTLLAVSASLVVAPFIQLIWDYPMITIGWESYYLPFWAFPLMVAAGALLFLVTLHLARLIARLHGQMAKALLVTGI
jgi:ABC-type multidrug transport system fused ATPase/permease subunit